MRLLAFSLLLTLFSVPAYTQEVLADNIIVEKSQRTLTLYSHDKVIRQYSIALGKQPVGPKMVEGDDRTPEGFYVITGHKEKSEYHRALLISYPDALDVERAQKLGVRPGGRIMIHGLPDDFGKRNRPRDWTWGCIAVTNSDIEEIWQLVPDGTPIEIRP